MATHLLFHIAAVCLYGYAAYVSPSVPGHSDTYGGELKFFTKWTHYVCLSYFLSTTILDLSDLLRSPGNNNTGSQQQHKSTIFASLVFPSTMITTIVFWVIYSLDPDMMVPVSVRNICPTNGFYNHAVHTAPFFTTLLESIVVFHRPDSLWKTMSIWLLFSASYLLWILWVAYKADIWVYPFLRAMSSVGKALFLIKVMLIGCLFVKVNHSFHNWFDKSETEQGKQKNKKKIK